MIGPSFYWNPHSACRLFKCQQLMGEWISDANSRMLISFARMNILFRHQGGAFPWITVEKHWRNTFGTLTNVFLFRPTAQCVGGKRWSADLFFRKNLPPSGWDPICVGGKRWSGPCQGFYSFQSLNETDLWPVITSSWIIDVRFVHKICTFAHVDMWGVNAKSTEILFKCVVLWSLWYQIEVSDADDDDVAEDDDDGDDDGGGLIPIRIIAIACHRPVRHPQKLCNLSDVKWLQPWRRWWWSISLMVTTSDNDWWDDFNFCSEIGKFQLWDLGHFHGHHNACCF